MTSLECQIGSTTLKLEDIASVRLEAAANQPASLTLWLEGGFYQTPSWPKDCDKPEIGSAVTFKLAGMGGTSPVKRFEGLLVTRRLIIEERRLRMQLICQCSAVKAGAGVLSRVIKKKIKDDALIKDVLEKSGVSLSGKQAKSTVEAAQRVLPPVTPWLYARHLAAANGFVLLPLLDGLSLADPKKPGKAHKIKLVSHGLLACELGQDATEALGSIKVEAWDIKEQKATDSQDLKAEDPQKSAAAKLSRPSFTLRRRDPVSKAECEAAASALLTRSWLSWQLGELELNDCHDIAPGDSITVEDLSGDAGKAHWISGVIISLDDEGLRTTLQLGLAAERFDPPDDLPCPGQMHGTVQAWQEDPQGLLRLPVKLQGIAEPDNVVFARLATPLAGKERGLFLLPQPEDEVIISFLGNAWDHPVISGAVHNPKQKPPFPYADKTAEHGLVLEKDQLYWLYDAKEKIVTLAANDKMTLKLADKDGLTITQDKNSFLMGKQVSLESSKPLVIKDSKSTMTFDNGGNVDIEPGSSVNIK